MRLGFLALFLVGGLALLAGPARARLGDPPDLVAAGKSGDMALAKDAFLRNDDPDVGDDDGLTPLYYAIKNNHPAMVQALLDHHAGPSRAGPDGKFPLYWAAEQGNVEMIQALVKAGAKLDQAAKSGVTALMVAASGGHDDAVLALLAAGAKPDLLDYTGRDALGWARDSHNPRVVQILSALQKR